MMLYDLTKETLVIALRSGLVNEINNIKIDITNMMTRKCL